MLDQEHFVAALVVDELVGDLLDQEHAEAAGPPAGLLALERDVDEILGPLRLGGVHQVGAIEAVAGIAEVVDNRALGARGRHLDHLVRIESRPVLHRVDQHLAECRHQQIAIGRRQRVLALGHEAHQPVGVQEMTRHAQRHPVGEP